MKGRDIEAAYEARLLEERLEQYLVVRCALCDWTESGLLRDTRHAHTQHRKKAHPEIRPTRKANKTRMLVSPTLKSLGENIAAVREQGGHRWDEAA